MRTWYLQEIWARSTFIQIQSKWFPYPWLLEPWVHWNHVLFRCSWSCGVQFFNVKHLFADVCDADFFASTWLFSFTMVSLRWRLKSVIESKVTNFCDLNAMLLPYRLEGISSCNSCKWTTPWYPFAWLVGIKKLVANRGRLAQGTEAVLSQIYPKL